MCTKWPQHAQAVDNAVRSIGMNGNSVFYCLMPQSIRWLRNADAILKSLHPKLFHVTRVAHLLHNCAVSVKSRFENADQLIAKVKSAAVKNKTR